ncbi:MAG: hypothetical protein ABEK10_00850 [Candidatus Nanosalina sp.]
MNLEIQKISQNVKKIGAGLLSIGIGASALAGFSILDDPVPKKEKVSTGSSVSTQEV